MSEHALLVIDQQIDFQPGGALAVEGGHEIVPAIASLMKDFYREGRMVVVTQDSHPAGHISFASSYEHKKPFEILSLAELRSNRIKSKHSREVLETYLGRLASQSQILWPDHCVTGTSGWFCDPHLPLETASLILRKGCSLICDSYSAFKENDGTSTGLAAFLRERQVTELSLVGLAGDYCVYWTALDALDLGFQVHFRENLTRYVNFPMGSKEKSLADLRQRGVHFS